MTLISTESKEVFKTQLCEEITRRLGPEPAAAVIDFALQYFENYPLEELDGRQLADVYGSCFALWNFLQCREDPSKPKVSVHNPTLEDDGWISPRTVAAVVHKDMSFLVDSIRLELNRRNIPVYTIHSAVLSISRDEHGKLQALLPKHAESGARQEEGTHREAAIYFEIGRHSDSFDREELQSAIEDVLNDVSLVTDDFQPAMAKVQEVLQELENLSVAGVSQEEIEEARAFLSWLVDDHFTFLGFTKHEIISVNGEKGLRESLGSRLGLYKARPLDNTTEFLRNLNQSSAQAILEPRLLRLSKYAFRSRVHRRVYADCVSVKRFNEKGRVVGEYRFMGLYTSTVYALSPFSIPVVRKRISNVMKRAGFRGDGHEGKDFQHVLETYPRDELFQSEEDELFEIALGIMRIQERRQVRLFVRRGPFGQFYSCIVYIPRDLYHTRSRERVQQILCDALDAEESEFETSFSESILARTYFLIRVDPHKFVKVDVKRLEMKIYDTVRSWEGQLEEALMEALGEEEGGQKNREFHDAFPASYRESFDAREAVNDVRTIASLDSSADIAMAFFRPMGESGNRIHFKLFHLEEILALSDVLPILENMGLRVINEHSYAIRCIDGKCVWLHDFRLSYSLSNSIEVEQVRENFKEAFDRVWSGQAESDSFNRLILGTRLGWRRVSILRAYARYMKQVGFPFSQNYIAETLSNHLPIAEDIVDLFFSRFDPEHSSQPEADKPTQSALQNRVVNALESVESLDQDRIIRRYLDLISGTLRTNYFQCDASGDPKAYLSLKFSTRDIPDVPEPRPLYEIFVYSPRVEGLHLRGGKVARGGLRWSDRKEDYRTEILGLVKAQQVKNAVIVPVGAKGGFITKRLNEGASREEIQKEGIACYQTLIRGLLDLTDNRHGGEVIRPENTICWDDEDAYLVVAADKGTATFSDIANEISAAYGFWLGDAFASGGSIGYDHKKMGITARGAWVSVQRHFRELGIDIQNEDFSVLGIGDMSGDVFGNGMLLSEHTKLVAAFNHLHVFLDPDPNPEASFRERERLFDAPRSSWSDYDASLISEGGGVFARTAKSIELSPAVRERFKIEAEQLTPNELISALLRAPVDLIWNGGIGTYIKSSEESQADAGDKANDVLRVDARDLRARVIGEGGNLGVTQLGRVEFCLSGGAANTDFIDNVGGVNCSDHEVNIKILLNELMDSGDLTEKQRRELLTEMTESVSELVLKDSYRQTQAISIAQSQDLIRMGEYRRYIRYLEQGGMLSRSLEFIPDDETLVERSTEGKGLTRPEFSVLVSYTKAILKEELLESDVPDDPFLSQAVESAFPEQLLSQYRNEIYGHRLKREIAATQIANGIVNRMGFSFVYRLHVSTGADAGAVARAYITAREIFGMDARWAEIQTLDHHVPVSVQTELTVELMRLVRRGSRWFLRNRRGELDAKQEIESFAPAIRELSESLPELLHGQDLEDWHQQHQALLQAGLPDTLAHFMAGATNLRSCLGIAEVARTPNLPIRKIAEVFFSLDEELELGWFGKQVANLTVENHWQAMARESALDDLDWQRRALTAGVLACMENGEPVHEGIRCWIQQYEAMVSRWRATLTELHGGATSDFAMYAVAIRELLDLAQASLHPR